jgi:membrane protease YdiL (CAAX protease family)
MDAFLWLNWTLMPPAIISLLIVTFTFLIYWAITLKTEKVPAKTEINQARIILINRISGFLLFGPVAFLLLRLQGNFCPCSVGMYMHYKPSVWFATFLLSLIVIGVNAVASKGQSNLQMYPQMRFCQWTPGWMLASAFSWILYLIGYEFLFRGLLFFSWVNEYMPTAAIAVNVCIYALVHIPKGWKETFGAIPMGIILCLLAFSMHSFWPAVFVHASLALSNEWFSIYYNPKMSITLKRK